MFEYREHLRLRVATQSSQGEFNIGIDLLRLHSNCLVLQLYKMLVDCQKIRPFTQTLRSMS